MPSFVESSYAQTWIKSRSKDFISPTSTHKVEIDTINIFVQEKLIRTEYTNNEKI